MSRLREMDKLYRTFRELGKIEKKLQKVNELYCTEDLTEKQIREEIALEAKAQALAEELGLCAIHQHDPRSGALFLIEKHIDKTNKEKLYNAEKLYLEY